MNNRVNFNRRSGRQNFSNCNGAPVEEEEQFNNRRVSPRRNAKRSGRQNFNNKRVSPRRSAKRTPNRRSGRQNFNNRRVGKERFYDYLSDTLQKLLIAVVFFIVGILIGFVIKS